MSSAIQITLRLKAKKFSVKEVESDAVYLTDSELRSLYNIDLSGNRTLESVRDLFVFSSYVGLRYSDATNIQPENIVNIGDDVFIKITPKKTGVPITIPCNDVVLAIFDKYAHRNNKLPTSICNQKFNKHLKKIGELAGLTEAGRLSSDLTKPLFSCLSSHTARRNFATNCYLAGMDSKMIRAVTGHKSEKTFESYIKVSKEEIAKKMVLHMKRGRIV